MHRTDALNNVAGQFTDNYQGTLEGTVVEQTWLNAVQEEIIGVLTLAGVVPAKANHDQLANAIALLITASATAHANLTNPHSATSAATASRLMLRDASGRAQVAAPSAAADIARKDTVDTHANLTNPHSATSAATASRLMLRDASGRSQVAAPLADADVANKGWVNSQRWISAAFTWVASSIITRPHNLGVPKTATVIAKCISPERGYAVGDWAYNLGWGDNTPAAIGTLPVRANAVDVSIATGDAGAVIANHVAGSGADWISMTPASWEFYFVLEF